MKKTLEPIVFFGSGPVAAQSLELLTKDFNVEAVITKPATTNKRDPVPVIDLAKKLKLKILSPTNKQELDELFRTKPVNGRLGVLIDYGIIVSQDVIDYFPLGIVNSHFSLLPSWRGPDPITFTLLSGETKTGVSLMLINAQMDEGLLLDQEFMTINPEFTARELTRKLVLLSHRMLKRCLPEYVAGSLHPYEQSTEIEPTYSRKLTKADGMIDWHKSANQINQEIKAYIDWPKSHTTINGVDVIVTRAHVVETSGKTGTLSSENHSLTLFCKRGALVIDRLKPLGKNEMDARSFIAGYIKSS